MKIFKRIKWSYVVLSVMFLLLGIYLVVNPETSLIMICRILGAAMAVFGVMKIVLYFIREVEGVAIRFDFAVGLFCIILGVLMLWRAPALTDILSLMTASTCSNVASSSDVNRSWMRAITVSM